MIEDTATTFAAMTSPAPELPNPRTKTVPDQPTPTRARSTRARVEPVRRFQIALRYSLGEKIAYIAAKEGVSKTLVMKVAGEFELPPRGHSGKQRPSAEELAALDAAIAKHLEWRSHHAGTPGATARATRQRHHYHQAALYVRMARRAAE